MNLEHTLEVAIGSVLFNVSNFPEAAHSKLWGQDMKPLNDKLIAALAPVIRRIQAEAWSEGHGQALANMAWPKERQGNPYRDEGE